MQVTDPYKITEGTEKGNVCNRNGCLGVIDEHEKRGCSCHINPPCSACVEPRAFCPVCNWDDKEEQSLIEQAKPKQKVFVQEYLATHVVKKGLIIENEECKLEIFRNPKRNPEHANAYYEVELLSGNWPEESLISICDNSGFNKGIHHFGGSGGSGGSLKRAYVTVYVD